MKEFYINYDFIKININKLNYNVIADLVIQGNEIIYIVNNYDKLIGCMTYKEIKKCMKKEICNCINLVNYNCTKINNSELEEKEIRHLFSLRKNINNIPVVNDDGKVLYEYCRKKEFSIWNSDQFKIINNYSYLIDLLDDYGIQIIIFQDVDGVSGFVNNFKKYLKEYDRTDFIVIIVKSGKSLLKEANKNHNNSKKFLVYNNANSMLADSIINKNVVKTDDIYCHMEKFWTMYYRYNKGMVIEDNVISSYVTFFEEKDIVFPFRNALSYFLKKYLISKGINKQIIYLDETDNNIQKVNNMVWVDPQDNMLLFIDIYNRLFLENCSKEILINYYIRILKELYITENVNIVIHPNGIFANDIFLKLNELYPEFKNKVLLYNKEDMPDGKIVANNVLSFELKMNKDEDNIIYAGYDISVLIEDVLKSVGVKTYRYKYLNEDFFIKRYYYQKHNIDYKEDKDFIIQIFNKLIDMEYIEEVIKTVPVVNDFYECNLHNIPDYHSKYVNTDKNGCRIHEGVPDNYKRTIWCIGSCQLFGYAIDDNNTMPAYLQKLVNENIGYPVRVKNLGVQGAGLQDIYKWVLNNDFLEGDCILINTETLNADIYIDHLKIYEKYFNNGKEWYFDHPNHAGSAAYKIWAECVFNIIKNHIYLSPDRKDKSINRIHVNTQFVIDKILEGKIKHYINTVKKSINFVDGQKIGCIVMNCNPFTNGHHYLIQESSKLVAKLIVFVVEENKSIFSFDDRIKLVREGVRDIENVTVLPSGQFMISSVTFPGYFNKNSMVCCDCEADLEIFCRYIAPALNIYYRFAGEEPNDIVTANYNITMSRILPGYNIQFVEIQRLKYDDNVISASRVRRLLNNFTKNRTELKELVPEVTYKYLCKKYLV